MQAVLVKGIYVCNVAIHYKEKIRLFMTNFLSKSIFSAVVIKEKTQFSDWNVVLYVYFFSKSEVLESCLNIH